MPRTLNSFVAIVLLMAIFLNYSCDHNQKESEFAGKIKNADAIELFYQSSKGSLHYVDSSKEMIEAFAQVLNGKIEKRKCPTTGEIRFISKDSAVFEAGFVTIAPNCEFIMQGEKAWRLSYQTGRWLEEINEELTQENEQHN